MLSTVGQGNGKKKSKSFTEAEVRKAGKGFNKLI
jgi:hypothetical protein